MHGREAEHHPIPCGERPCCAGESRGPFRIAGDIGQHLPYALGGGVDVDGRPQFAGHRNRLLMVSDGDRSRHGHGWTARDDQGRFTSSIPGAYGEAPLPNHWIRGTNSASRTATATSTSFSSGPVSPMKTTDTLLTNRKALP